MWEKRLGLKTWVTLSRTKLLRPDDWVGASLKRQGLWGGPGPMSPCCQWSEKGQATNHCISAWGQWRSEQTEGVHWHKLWKILIMVLGGVCQNTHWITPCCVWGPEQANQIILVTKIWCISCMFICQIYKALLNFGESVPTAWYNMNTCYMNIYAYSVLYIFIYSTNIIRKYFTLHISHKRILNFFTGKKSNDFFSPFLYFLDVAAECSGCKNLLLRALCTELS